MDPNLPPSSQPVPAVISETSSPVVPPKTPLSKKMLLLIGMGGFALILIVLFFLLGGRHTSKSLSGSQSKNAGAPTAYPTSSPTDASTSALPFVYGAWFTNESRIYLVTPGSTSNTLLATLPISVKKMSPISQSQILYINHTNEHDQGTDISLLDTSTKQTRQVVLPDAGYLIDDYDVSPNGRSLVDWELQLNPATNTVKGGKSRIYTVDLSVPTKKTLLYDEADGDTPIHFPLVVTNTKQIFLDTYLPNSGVGYAYGMAESSFDGVTKTDLSTIQNGTYSTQPQVSSDGRYLLFTSYDQSKGKGTDLANGTRIALQNPTAIDIYDIQTKTRRTLSNLPQKKLFYNIVPSRSNPDIFFFRIASSPTTLESAVYKYSIKNQTATRIAMPNIGTAPVVVSALSPSVLLIGTMNSDTSIVGNLGQHYDRPFTALSVWDTESNTVISHPLGEVALAQFIGTTSSITKVLGDQTGPSPNLQENTFTVVTETPVPTPTTVPAPPAAPVVVPDLQVERQEQQSISNNGNAERENPGLSEPQSQHCDSCEDPIYLYGPIGKNVRVSVGSVPHINDVTLTSGDRILLNGFVSESLSYEFTPSIQWSAPTSGTIATAATIQYVLHDYARGLGLSTRETQDLLSYAKDHLSAPFTFVSFFDETTSERLLPISYTPQPDHVQSVVFYFKDLHAPVSSPRMPQFPDKGIRSGFTVVSIGEVHEYYSAE